MFKILQQSFNLTSLKKRDFFIFFIVSFLYSLTELFGIGLIVVFISFLLSNNLDDKSVFYDSFIRIFPISSDNSFIFFVSIIFLIFLLRFFVAIILKLYETNFKKNLTIDLVTKTLERYLKQSYEWYVSIGSNRLIVNIIENCNSIIDVVIIRLFTSITSLVILLAFISSLIFINPLLVAFVTVLMTLISISIYKIFSEKNKQIGKKQFFYFNCAYSFVKSALESFSIIKILKKNNYFLNKFGDNFSNFQNQIFHYEMIREFSKILFEFLFISIICITLFFGYINKETNILNLEFLVFYSLIFLRSLPHYSIILNYFRDVKKVKPQLDSVINIDLNSTRNDKKTEINTFKNIELQKIDYKYKSNHDFKISASISVKSGEKVAIVGMSGSGKTTLAHLIMGLIKPIRGLVKVDGEDIEKLNANFISYIPQRSFLVNDTFLKNITLELRNEDRIKISRLLKETYLEDVSKRFNTNRKNFFGNEINLSSGELQRLSICRGLYSNPQLLVLDEPTSNLDAINEKRFMKILESLNNKISVIMITHKIKIIKNFGKIIFMDKGKIVDIGSFSDLYEKNKRFKLMYDFQLFSDE